MIFDFGLKIFSGDFFKIRKVARILYGLFFLYALFVCIAFYMLFLRYSEGEQPNFFLKHVLK